MVTTARLAARYSAAEPEPGLSTGPPAPAAERRRRGGPRRDAAALPLVARHCRARAGLGGGGRSLARRFRAESRLPPRRQHGATATVTGPRPGGVTASHVPAAAGRWTRHGHGDSDRDSAQNFPDSDSDSDRGSTRTQL